MIVAISAFIAGGPVLIIGIEELTKDCNNKVNGVVTSVEPTSEYGVVRYTDHHDVVHEVRVQLGSVANDTGTVVPGCYNARHPDTLFTDDDHLENVTSFKDARTKVIAGTILLVFAVVALILLCVWARLQDTRNPRDSKAVPHVVRQDSASEMYV